MNAFEAYPVIPVIVLDDAEQALPLAEALLEAGMGVIEITFRTAAAAESIRRIAEHLPEMWVGAGTVITLEEAQRAVDCGARFALAPGCDPETICFFREHRLPFVPGVQTPSEVQTAYKLGCPHQKFFPAGSAGGVKMLRDLSAPYLHLGIQFCPTGGVNLENMSEYLRLPQVFAVGGSWIATREQIAKGEWDDIRAQARQALDTARAAKG